MDYKGVIIEESLSDREILKELKIVQTVVSKTTAKEETPWLKEWTLQTVVIPYDKIDEYANKLSKLIDLLHCGSWYCDFRNEKYHYIIFSNKIFKLDRNNKQDYIGMRNYALNIGLPEHQLPNYSGVDTNILIKFLIKAKKQTYANSNAEKIESSRLGSKDYHYEEEIDGEVMRYHDTYFGGVRFIGEEVVYYGTDSPKWGMNYYGVTIDENLSEEAMDKVLRPALMKVGEDNDVVPVRGPSIIENEDYIYTFASEGEIENFTGVEEIYKGEKLIYRLYCHGGIIE